MSVVYPSNHSSFSILQIKWSHIPVVLFIAASIFAWFRIKSDTQPTATATDVTAKWKDLISQTDYQSFEKPVVSALTQRYNGRSGHPVLVDFISRTENIKPEVALTLVNKRSRDIDATIIKALGNADGTIATAGLGYLCSLQTKHLQLVYQQLSTTDNQQTEFLGTLSLGCLPSPYAEEALLPLENSSKPHVAKAVQMAFQRKGLFGH